MAKTKRSTTSKAKRSKTGKRGKATKTVSIIVR